MSTDYTHYTKIALSGPIALGDENSETNIINSSGQFVGAVTCNSNATVVGSLTVKTNATVSGTLAVLSTVTMKAGATVSSTLSVGGALTAKSTLSVSSTLSANGLVATKRQNVTGSATLASIAPTCSFIKIVGYTGAIAVTGINAGADGQILKIYHSGNSGTAGALTFHNEETAVTAAKRIKTLSGGDVSTTGVGAAELIYDSVTARWILLYCTA